MSEITRHQMNHAAYTIRGYQKNGRPRVTVTVYNGQKSMAVSFDNKEKVWEFVHDLLGTMSVFEDEPQAPAKPVRHPRG